MMLMLEKSMIVFAIEPGSLAAFTVGAITGVVIARVMAKRQAGPTQAVVDGHHRRPADSTPSPPPKP
ncbi:hypothetical protein [Nevskia sp.]|uniref:hypothetical protein n=1 Tax=Nevskia sp. TaxID=1929292 RepID=UPI0025EEBAE2|nr:hypothetical protein [Nevskia sp.]